MRLTWLIIFVVLNVCSTANGTSNDIVGTMRCRLLCDEAGGYASELRDGNICWCNILKTLNDKQQLKVQELSTYYNLPVLFERHHRNYRVKRQLDENLLDDWRATLDEQWAEAADNLKALGEQHARANPLFGGLEDQAETIKENLRNWHKEHIEDNTALSDLEEHAANLQAMHNDNMEILQEHKEKFEENLKTLSDTKDGAAEQLKQFHEENIEPLLGAPLPTLQETMDKLKAFHNNQEEPILGQMAPSLSTYDSKSTGIGGGYVNFPPADHPNPFVPGLAHVIRALPFPQFNVGARAPAAPALFGRAPAPQAAGPTFPLPRLFSRSYAAPSLPANYAGPYNPKNPIVVQPIVAPPPFGPPPKPILSGLQNSVDDMLASMKKNGGRLIPENYLNSDALSNSESQVNQINVNVRVEPTPTPPNLYSLFMPWNRNWLSAPVPKHIDENGDEVTENPGIIDDSDEANDGKRNNEDDDEEEDYDEERRMQKKLKDADKSKFNAHVVDSVKKNLGRGSRPEQDGKQEAGKYGNGLIVQPKEFMQDTEEDLETLAK